MFARTSRVLVVGCIAVLALLVHLPRCGSATESGIVKLNHESFAKHIESHDASLLMFMAKWCGHCKNTLGDFEGAAKELADNKALTKKLSLATFECTEDSKDKEVCEKHDVRAFPTFIIFEKDNPIQGFDVQRTKKEFLELILKFDGAAIKMLSSGELTELKNYGMPLPLAVAYFKSGDALEYRLLETVAKAMRFEITIKMTADPSAIKMDKGAEYGLVMFRVNEGQTKFSGKWDVDVLTAFIKDEKFPVVGEINSETFSGYQKSGKRLFYLFVDQESQRDKFRATLEKIASKFRSKMNVGFINASLYGDHGVDMGLPKSWPGIAVTDKNGSKWLFPQDQKFTEENILKFADQVDTNNVEPHVKSEPIPKASDSHVQTIVAKNFDDVVLRPNQDVLVFYHAEWCGHCRKFSPTYEELAKSLASHKERILFTKLDATKNDVPISAKVQVRGFPTIVLYHGTSKEAITHEGGRKFEDVLKFLRDNAMHGSAVPQDMKPGEGSTFMNEEL